MPFLCELSPHEPWKGIDSAGEFACSAASLLYPTRVGARQPLDRQLRYYSEGWRLASEPSRTFKREYPDGESPEPGPEGESLHTREGGGSRARAWRLQTQKSHPRRSGSWYVYGSLASPFGAFGRRTLPCASAGFPDRLLFPLRVRSSAVARSWNPRFSVAVGASLRQPEHHWHLSNSNPMAVLLIPYFH
jgi:hypothetical protein